jgi:hypothetical protein
MVQTYPATGRGPIAVAIVSALPNEYVAMLDHRRDYEGGTGSVSGLFGKGTWTFVDLGAQERFDFKDPRYRVTDKATRQPVAEVTPDAVSKLEALVILEQLLTTNPANRGRYQVSRVDPPVAA